MRKEKGKKFPWQADEQVDEGRSGGDTNEEGEGGKKRELEDRSSLIM